MERERWEDIETGGQGWGGEEKDSGSIHLNR